MEKFVYEGRYINLFINNALNYSLYEELFCTPTFNSFSQINK